MYILISRNTITIKYLLYNLVFFTCERGSALSRGKWEARVLVKVLTLIVYFNTIARTERVKRILRSQTVRNDNQNEQLFHLILVSYRSYFKWPSEGGLYKPDHFVQG